MAKVRQTFRIGLTDVNCECAIYMVRTVSNINNSNGPYDKYVVEVTSSCSQ